MRTMPWSSMRMIGRIFPAITTGSLSEDQCSRCRVETCIDQPRVFSEYNFLSILEVVGVRITKQPIEVSGFGGNSTYTFAFC